MEDNKIIAEFMGADDLYDGMSDARAKRIYNYHTSWDWLMPVIEECKATNVHPKMPTIMQSTLTLILDEIDALMIGHWGIEMTYKEVVKFITKYNEYKTHTT